MTIKAFVVVSSFLTNLKHPILYIVGILMTKAKMSSMKVFRAL